MQISDNRNDNACVLHMLAVAPEARCLGVARAMMKSFANEQMRRSRILIAVMYPEEFLPMLPNLETLKELMKKRVKLRQPAHHCQKVKSVARLSPAYFFMNKLHFLIWNFVDQRLKQHSEFDKSICMFGEKAVLQKLNIADARLQQNAALTEVQYSNCNAMKVEYVKCNDTEKYQLVVQTCLIGRVDIVISRYDKQALEDGTNASQNEEDTSNKSREQLDHDWHEVYRDLLVDNLWAGSKIAKNWEKQITEGIRSYFGSVSDGTNLIKDDYVNIKGMGRKEKKL